MSITIKDEAGIAAMRTACRLAAEVLDAIAPHVKPGITTLEIDRLCAQAMTRQGTRSATIGYQPQGYPPYPGHVCTSVNHVICHGIPSDKKLKKGDIVNVDVTVITPEGWYGDTSRMFEIGACSIAARRLCALTHEAMWRGIAQARPGAHLGDIGHAIQQFVEGHGLSVVREFCGHGIGRNFHEEPQVLLRQAGRRREAGAGHGLYHRADGQHRPRRNPQPGRWLDHRHARPFALGPVGTHAGRHARGLRGAFALSGHAARAGFRPRYA
jgi:methionyl aminopeptidase